MASVIKGKATCPECGSEQDVKHDGRKFYINCADCRTMTSYQSKVAQTRILERMTVETEVKPPPIPAHKHTTGDSQQAIIEQLTVNRDEPEAQSPFFSDFNLL